MNHSNQHHFKLLLEKYRAGSCTPEELEHLYRLADDPEMIPGLTFTSDEEKTQINDDIKHNIAERVKELRTEWPERKTASIKLRRRLWIAIVAAALIACISLLAIRFSDIGHGQGDWVDINTPAGVKSMPVMLPDSSVVRLYAGSRLKYPRRFKPGSRNIELLSGSAFLQVRPDKKAPFVVTVPGHIMVKVLGTSFGIATHAGYSIKVSVEKGKVQVGDKDKVMGVLLPGEELVYNYRQKTSEKTKNAQPVPEDRADEETVYLERATIDEIATVLKVVYKVELVYQPALKQYRLNARFSTRLSVDEVLDVLGAASGLEFKRHLQDVTVTAK
ncbi:FecR family protein [Taibaiella chishuiensis]|uniref:FecR family protein n=1 Tax=Taibaiella chishuiensis TaxID=1434707 RepID=A0A2P8CT52_9BACT|nr:FecR family protein [Taibaiella chishuiensis]PSK88127.1 FecR family protein [Taibaiella chishuiensis]